MDPINLYAPEIEAFLQCLVLISFLLGMVIGSILRWKLSNVNENLIKNAHKLIKENK